MRVRPLILLFLSLSLVSCTDDDGSPTPACTAFLACVEKVAPETLSTVSASYGPDGHCWKNGEAAKDTCEQSCRDNLERYVQSGQCEPIGQISSMPDEGDDDADANTVCDAFVACVQTVAPETLTEINKAYGPDGYCWTTGEGARDACIQACRDNLARYVESGQCEPFEESDSEDGNNQSCETWEDCSNDFQCLEEAHSCVECLNFYDCPLEGNIICTGEHKCATCTTSEQCAEATSGERPVCAPTQDDPTVTECVECHTNDDCWPARPVCNLDRCAQCNSAADCDQKLFPQECRFHQCEQCEPPNCEDYCSAPGDPDVTLGPIDGCPSAP